MTLTFDVYAVDAGGYTAHCQEEEGIVTQAETFEELQEMVVDAVRSYFFDQKGYYFISLVMDLDTVRINSR